MTISFHDLNNLDYNIELTEKNKLIFFTNSSNVYIIYRVEMLDIQDDQIIDNSQIAEVDQATYLQVLKEFNEPIIIEAETKEELLEIIEESKEERDETFFHLLFEDCTVEDMLRLKAIINKTLLKAENEKLLLYNRLLDKIQKGLI